ncbi:hypothetical protein KUTeg_023258 [Tegillarca granosa]|uniref:Carbohydrate-binding module family 19 domain-containing protein n=1 Tax=Tegillarca granosa TaxID=220873 RepID=A0ABQ9E143_TEGGR|nr:hypothetical protein KUTeg_023258 [Tegillarca granosa]
MSVLYLSTVLLLTIPEVGSIRIIIEGTREKSYVGDIAVDDFKFYNCTETTTSPFETTLTTTNDVETTHDQGTSIADVQTIDTKDPFSKISPVTSRVKITTTSPPTSTPSTFSLTVANRSISTDSKYQKTTNIMMKTKKFTNNEIQNKNQFTTEHNMNLTKSERTTLGFILTSNKNGNLLTLGVTGSTSKTTLDTNKKDIPSKSIITGSGYTSTLKSTGNGSSTHSMSGRQGKFHYARLMTVSTSSSQQNYTKNNLKAGDLSEHLIQNTTLIIVISVCTICVTAIVLIIIIFICRKRKSQDDDPLEEMKTHFVYKKSVDFTMSRENMTEDVCNQGFGLPVRDLL